MLNYFTTWNIAMVLNTSFRERNSRSLLALSSCISLAGAAMFVDSCRRWRWRWKDCDINWYEYIIMEFGIHQAPLALLLYTEPVGNAWNALIPAGMYCTFVENPYKLGNHKLKNYYGLLMIGVAAPLVNYLTKKTN